MRVFNKFEKIILKKLLIEYDSDIVSVNLIDFFKQNVMIDRALRAPYDSQQITIHYNNDFDKKAPREIFNFFTLLEYLESQALIYKVKNINDYKGEFISRNLESLGTFQISPIKGKWDFKKNKLPNIAVTFLGGFIEKLKDINNQDIILSSELIELINDNFITIENKSYIETKRQTILSFSALGLSLITLIFSWYLLYKSENKSIRLEQTQIDNIIKPLNRINSKIETLNKNFSTIKIKEKEEE